MTTEVNRTTRSTFDRDVLSAAGPVLVDFYADWCAPCRAVAPVVRSLAADFGDALTVTKVDVDQNQELAAKYGVRGIPTLILFKDGTPVETAIGLASVDTLSQVIRRHL